MRSTIFKHKKLDIFYFYNIYLVLFCFCVRIANQYKIQIENQLFIMNSYNNYKRPVLRFQQKKKKIIISYRM